MFVRDMKIDTLKDSREDSSLPGILAPNDYKIVIIVPVWLTVSSTVLPGLCVVSKTG